MSNRVVEIETADNSLSLHKNFLRVTDSDGCKHDLDLDELTSVLFKGYGGAISKNLIVELSDRNIPIIFCDNKYFPASICMPTHMHSDQHRRFIAQTRWDDARKAQAWRKIISSKILNQHLVLKHFKGSAPSLQRLLNLSETVQDGDVGNCEAIAAKMYFRALFGTDFRRNRTGEDIVNILLNYGYILLRSAVVRAIFLSGLHPTFGIHHKNRLNSFCLADDLMEPYRPFIDSIIYKMAVKGTVEALNKEAKLELADALLMKIRSKNLTYTIGSHTIELCNGLIQFMNVKKGVNLTLPEFI